MIYFYFSVSTQFVIFLNGSLSECMRVGVGCVRFRRFSAYFCMVDN